MLVKTKKKPFDFSKGFIYNNALAPVVVEILFFE